MEEFLVYELYDIFSECEKENEELIDEFAYKDPEEKYKIVRNSYYFSNKSFFSNLKKRLLSPSFIFYG